MTDENGCTSSQRQLIEVIQESGVMIPGAFSPNGDGANDVFQIRYYQLSEFKIEISDINGLLVYQSNDPNFVWDGRDMQGEELAQGEYIFALKAIDANNQVIAEKRSVFLIR